jgi:hypothetical protein
MAGGGLLLACCGGLLIAVPKEAASKPSPKGTITLTHADRVLLTAERMHAAGIRANPADSLDTQLRIAAFGDSSLKSPRQDVSCEWQLAAFHEERCFLKFQAGGRWSDKAARVVVAEFNRYSRTLSPGAAKEVAALVHAVGSGRPRERKIADYRFRVTLHEDLQTTDEGQWELLIELWPLKDDRL